MTNAAERVCDSKTSRRGGKEKQWTDCVQNDIRAFGIAGGGWKAMVLKAEVWVETAMEGGRRFMAAWRKQDVAFTTCHVLGKNMHHQYNTGE